MNQPIKAQRVVSVTTIVITTIGVLLGSVQDTSAQEPQRLSAAPASKPTSAGLDVLENAFWMCDYVATTRGNGDISTCTAVYEALKERKFGGDFDSLWSWWRQNKAAQHQNIAAADSAAH